MGSVKQPATHDADRQYSTHHARHPPRTAMLNRVQGQVPVDNRGDRGNRAKHPVDAIAPARHRERADPVRRSSGNPRRYRTSLYMSIRGVLTLK
jgi:hypothetical protein